jgi:hypothetical protein
MKEIDKICMKENRKIKIIPVLAKDKKVGKKNNATILPKY